MGNRSGDECGSSSRSCGWKMVKKNLVCISVYHCAMHAFSMVPHPQTSGLSKLCIFVQINQQETDVIVPIASNCSLFAVKPQSR